MKWIKAKRCNSGHCVEAAHDGQSIAIRDSKNPDGAALTFSKTEFALFIGGVRAGDFNELLD